MQGISPGGYKLIERWYNDRVPGPEKTDREKGPWGALDPRDTASRKPGTIFRGY
jgi:hypothetical protein